MSATEPLRRTPLYDLHVARGGRMVDFAGYEMPVRYSPGPVAEHQHTRQAASIFDVSHMGVVELAGADVAAHLEALVPSAITTLAPGRSRYTMLTTPSGGVIDDLMVTAVDEERLSLVVNASRKEVDTAHLRAGLPAGVTVVPRPDLALVALQGPAAVSVLSGQGPGVAGLVFMQAGRARVAGVDVGLTRSGYTGEDGYELSVPADAVAGLVAALLDEPEVELAGLAARDSLRLEAGLCLYGHDLDEATTPAEAGLGWAIPKRRREDARFPGAPTILAQLAEGPDRHRVGLVPLGRKPLRDGAPLLQRAGHGGATVGTVTSGGFGPTFGGPIAMGYVATGSHAVGTELAADVRGTLVDCRVVDLPFVPHRYVRGA
ncbi:MAG: glycine cleavage system aminomethyltransferase GcvT [Acidimicrobiia bacterium]|nr:glycine cleavage system aminomethyltransferase GcvT [Acidimicrobiia bacterium]